jgi:hypothetical protein
MPTHHDAEFEVTISEIQTFQAHPGFHETRTRTFYVTTTGSVYLLAAPGQRAMLQLVEHLPADATPSGRIHDLRLRTLADVANDLAAPRRAPLG